MIQPTVDRRTAAALAMLRGGAQSQPEEPTVGPRGQLNYRGRTVCLSERNALLVGVLVYHFGSELTDLELLDRVWPEGATRRTLRLHLRRLDRRLTRVGLRIVESGDRSHALLPLEGR
jgi:DNA-binding response OmpR family regulator